MPCRIWKIGWVSLCFSAAAASRARSSADMRAGFLTFGGVHEMFMTGTAAEFPRPYSNAVVTSDLTGEELWSILEDALSAKLGRPVRLMRFR